MAKFESGKPRHPNAGRKKGTPNKSSQDLMAKCEAKGLDVFEAMVDFAMNSSEVSVRVTMLKELAGYLYPKRKALEVSVKSEIDQAAEDFQLLPPEKQAELLETQAKKIRGDV